MMVGWEGWWGGVMSYSIISEGVFCTCFFSLISFTKTSACTLAWPGSL